MVMVAPEATVELEKEAEIWEDDFLETVDPELIKEYQIQKRDQLYREQQEKEAKEAEEKSKEAESAKAEKTIQNFEDINLDDINDPIQLEFYGMDHLKFVLEAKGLKCGGNLQERCKRLLMTKGSYKYRFDVLSEIEAGFKNWSIFPKQTNTYQNRHPNCCSNFS